MGSALPHLTAFHSKLFTFMSFSSPHLGYIFNSSTFVKHGLWLVKKLRASHCLEQLSLEDDSQPERCFLYRLAETPGLEYFQHVALVSSFQDHYAPFESARIESAPA